MIKKNIACIGLVLMLIVLVLQCVVSPVENEASDEPKVFFTQRLNQSGYFEWISIKKQAIENTGFPVFHDAMVKTYKKDVYIIERFGADNIIKYDPSKNGKNGLVNQMKTDSAEGSNPQDIAFLSDTKAFIANQNKPAITLFNPLTLTKTGTIDISKYTYMKDRNTSPHASSLEIDGNYLYVLLQRRDGYTYKIPSLILKINMLTNEIEDTVSTVYKNGNKIICNNGYLYVMNTGSYSAAAGDAGIEAVKLSDKSVTTVITAEGLGGCPYNVQHKNGDIFYVTVYVTYHNVHVKEIDFSTGNIVAVVPDVNDAFGGICYDKKNNTLYVGECDSLNMGIKVFKNNILQGPVIKTSRTLIPSSIAIINE
ncbi:MAG: hypothetical protein GX639_04180 [Fibrobacter sp.]|nr:hypothetical protein [Fibrobacter sp.]